jgi:hypothetical protein
MPRQGASSYVKYGLSVVPATAPWCEGPSGLLREDHRAMRQERKQPCDIGDLCCACSCS